ncbi:DoxX [Rhodococcus gordoniae]|uniref:DoxX n=1 Tax=Rhodococcus gordoniae TaxID=223392 RepID=A0A379LXI1_9NOCA|nr:MULTISPECIES: DoxX family protein [Rhodococcus]UTT47310.1 DoxX family protein [Rhodococcus gordoniae]SUE14602.1 DoxX [Rhodococcus gordoniae]
MADNKNGGVPDAGSSPYGTQPDERTLEMRRPRESYLGSDDDFDAGTPLGNDAYAAPTEQMYRPEPVYGAETGGAVAAGERTPVKVRRGTLDLGLFVLRAAVGAILVAHGLQKLVGLWNGPGLDGFEALLRDAGYREPAVLAIVGAVGEIAAGALLVLGLLTPFAAAAIVAIMINAVLFEHELEPGVQFFAAESSGFEFEALLVACAVAITLTGPGRIAVDGRRGWATRPFVGSFTVLLLGVAAGVCLWIFGR